MAGFEVGDRVENISRGMAARQVWGVQRSPEGSFLQFAPNGEWISATGFVAAADPAPSSDPVPISDELPSLEPEIIDE